MCAELSNCDALNSIEYDLKNDENVNVLLSGDSCHVSKDCNLIHCGLLDDREFRLEIMHCDEPPGIRLTVTDQGVETVYTFTDGVQQTEVNKAMVMVSITQKNSSLGLEVCSL